MPKYIERETLLKHAIALNNPHELGENVVPVSDIEAAPAADVAEVVHCKDCRWWNRKYTTVGECEKLADRDQEGGAQFDCDTEDDDFCSYGKRKEAT